MNLKRLLGCPLALVPCLLLGLPAACAAQPTVSDLHSLQGIWQGGVVGDKSPDKITITISGDSFRFHRDTNFWFETTITLPERTAPQQLVATIKGSAPSQASAIGKVVAAIFKIEGGKLTLASGSGEGAPKSFDAADDKGLLLYELQKVRR